MDGMASQSLTKMTKPTDRLYGIAAIKAQNAELRQAVAYLAEENAMLKRRLSTAADKQILLLNKLIDREQ